MELEQLLFCGSLSGLTSILGHSVLWSVIGFVRKPLPGAHDPQVQISEAFLHMLFGISLGLLFWLSWGLAAIVQVAWWIRGLTFGGIAALLLVPASLNFRSEGRIDAKRFAIVGSRWLTTCLLAGLSCAWSWERL
ncbi:MAG TPA: hypothetical protein VIL28_05355 [Steroidobacteraceae bacterium]|mgnify:CR=1 FL=1